MKRILLCFIFVFLFFLTACQSSHFPYQSDSNNKTTMAQSTNSLLEETSEPESVSPEFRSIAEEWLEWCSFIMLPEHKNWFEQYNGEKIQRIDVVESGTGVAQSSDIVFYWASENESIDSILSSMLNALYEPYLVPDANRTFTITQCFLDIPNQKKWEKIDMEEALIERAWINWNKEHTFLSMQECIMDTLFDTYLNDGLFPLRENTILLPYIEGYYNYDGVDVYPYEEYARQFDNDTPFNLLPFYREGTSRNYVYLLISNDRLYRLQRMTNMNISFPHDAEIDPDEFRALADLEINTCLQKIDSQKPNWFNDYNGDSLQIISGDGNRPRESDDIVYYHSSGNETIEEIWTIMIDALLQRFLEKNDIFTVTEYDFDIETQNILTCKEATEQMTQRLWYEWLHSRTKSEINVYLQKELRNSFDHGFLISEDMWMIPSLKLFYKYEGREINGTFDSYIGKYPNLAQNGLMPVGDGMPTLVLVKEGDVYRLQSAYAMGLDLTYQ